MFALYSPKGTYDDVFLANYATINLNDPLTRVPGVGQVRSSAPASTRCASGSSRTSLAKLGITSRRSSTRSRQPEQGESRGPDRGRAGAAGAGVHVHRRPRAAAQTPEEFGEIVVRAQPDGSVVRLKDVARIELGSSYYNSVGRFNGKPAAVIAIYQMPGSNALETAERAQEADGEGRRSASRRTWTMRSRSTPRSRSARASRNHHTLSRPSSSCILVVFIFLQGWRATLIPLLAVPVSLIGTFAFFPLLGFSINTLSLFGLVLAIGLVVDDAIVVVEAVERTSRRACRRRRRRSRRWRRYPGPSSRSR